MAAAKKSAGNLRGSKRSAGGAKRAAGKPKKPATYKGKSTAPGGGGSFQMAVDAMKAKGMPESMAKAIAAKQGRAKYGAKKMSQFAAKGRKRAAKKK